jgi:hypothetical protein
MPRLESRAAAWASVPRQQIGRTIIDCEATRFTKPRLRKLELVGFSG